MSKIFAHGGAHYPQKFLDEPGICGFLVDQEFGLMFSGYYPGKSYIFLVNTQNLIHPE